MRPLIVKLLVLLALVMSAFALLSAIVAGFNSPGWVLPLGCVSGFLALALMAF